MENPQELEQQIIQFKKQHLGDGEVKVRSAFNGEDVNGYSAPGLYGTYNSFSDNDIILNIKRVWASKWNEKACNSRLNHQIPHARVQPTVIIQEKIPADYSFTIYSQDPRKNNENKVFIEMYKKDEFEQNNQDPYIIIYDKDSEKIEIEAKLRTGRKIVLDENLKIIKEESELKDPISEDKEQWLALLKKIGKAAAQIQGKFGGPQDIEGGIVLDKDSVENSKIYVWQTRPDFRYKGNLYK